ncbi:hypothetical protein G4B88_002378 (mitochondrion) [Cannabis sativa]|uniref:Uncharacterized protein n=1 Tax=Cannabis sativa TaxID=3483 RepID=A0A7J6DVB1_CANSA|nr:hypothetical protein G4B88_002378 [Cannabis sativa]
MHNRGWRSVYCITKRDAFRGTAPPHRTFFPRIGRLLTKLRIVALLLEGLNGRVDRSTTKDLWWTARSLRKGRFYSCQTLSCPSSFEFLKPISPSVFPSSSLPKGKTKARGWGNPRLRGQITPSSLIQLGLVCTQRETLPHVFQFESHPVLYRSSKPPTKTHETLSSMELPDDMTYCLWLRCWTVSGNSGLSLTSDQSKELRSMEESTQPHLDLPLLHLIEKSHWKSFDNTSSYFSMISDDQDNSRETLSFHSIYGLQPKQIAFPIDLSPGLDLF